MRFIAISFFFFLGVKALSTDIVTIWKDIIIDETGGTDKGAVAGKY